MAYNSTIRLVSANDMPDFDRANQGIDVELTVTIPDDLASRLRPVGDRLPQVLELGLRQINVPPGDFAGLADVLEALARLPSAEEVLALRPSLSLQERIEMLLDKNRDGVLSEAERIEWQQYLYVEHLVRIAKAKATLKLMGK